MWWHSPNGLGPPRFLAEGPLAENRVYGCVLYHNRRDTHGSSQRSASPNDSSCGGGGDFRRRFRRHYYRPRQRMHHVHARLQLARLQDNLYIYARTLPRLNSYGLASMALRPSGSGCDAMLRVL